MVNLNVQNNKISLFLVKVNYFLTYIVQILFFGYLVLLFFDKADLPLGVNEEELFWLLVTCIVIPLTCHFCLYCRYRFDLLKMSDGTSPISRFIWTTLALLMNILLLNVFFRDLVRLY